MVEVLESIFWLIITILTALVIPYLKVKYGSDKITNAYNIIKILVQSVEQITVATGAGQLKKQQVIERFEDYGINIDKNKIGELIEAAVYEMNNTEKKGCDK